MNNQVKKLPVSIRSQLACGRFSWSTDDKISIVKQAEERGYTVVAREFGLDRSQLSHWRKYLQEKGLMLWTPLRRGRPQSKKKVS